MEPKEIMKLIEKERVKQGVSINEMARRVGVSASNIEHWKNGGGITLKKADKVLKVLGLTVTIGKENES